MKERVAPSLANFVLVNLSRHARTAATMASADGRFIEALTKVLEEETGE